MDKNRIKITEVKTIKSTNKQKNIRDKKDIIKEELAKRRQLIQKYRNNYRSLSAVIVIFVLMIAGYFIYEISHPNPVPFNIQNSVKFAIFYPSPSKTIIIKKPSFKYDKSKGQLIFDVSFEGNEIIFSEQSSPDSFSADPNFYQNLVQSLDDYATFQSLDGRVDLTIPAQTKQQTAIMNAKGTLVFANSNKKMSEANWKLLFNSVDNTQPQ
jgi:hypothetical protein